MLTSAFRCAKIAWQSVSEKNLLVFYNKIPAGYVSTRLNLHASPLGSGRFYFGDRHDRLFWPLFRRQARRDGAAPAPAPGPEGRGRARAAPGPAGTEPGPAGPRHRRQCGINRRQCGINRRQCGINRRQCDIPLPSPSVAIIIATAIRFLSGCLPAPQGGRVGWTD